MSKQPKIRSLIPDRCFTPCKDPWVTCPWCDANGLRHEIEKHIMKEHL